MTAQYPHDDHGRHSQRYTYPPPAPAPRNGLGLAALILGLVALPFTLTGLTAWLAIILGLIAAPLAIAGISRARRGQATNKRTAIVGLVAGVLAVALGIASTVVTVQALDDALSGPEATVTGPVGEEPAPAGPVPLGTTVDVDGLSVTVTEIVSRTDLGKRLTCAEVSYRNGRDDVAYRNPIDWAARNADGASNSSWIYAAGDALDSGTLAPGGTDTGLVCFDVPRDDAAVIEYRAGLSGAPTAEWVTR